MFVPISVILGFLISASTLPNGIRLIELPARGDTVEIIAGYDEGGLTGLASVPGARQVIFRTFATGGDLRLLNQQDRTALQLTVPRWAVPVIADGQLANLLKDVPRETVVPPMTDFRSKVEEEIRLALLGPQAQQPEYATSDAFVAMSGQIPDAVRDALAAIPRRASSDRPNEQVSRLPAERTFRFKSDLPTGAVVFAVPVPSIYYREWYLLLLLDRVIHRVLSVPMETALTLSLHSYYYRLELPLAAGQFPEPAEDKLLQELQRLEFASIDAQHLLAARQESIAYLGSNDVREWFASRGISDRLQEGIQWVQSMTTDDFRAAARDLLLTNRVIATWPPKPKQTTVEAESLTGGEKPSVVGAGGSRRAPAAAGAYDGSEDARIETFPFPSHKDSVQGLPAPQRLDSGVSILPSNINAVFVSGGTITKYDREPDADTMKLFEKYPAGRILVLAPPAGINHARELWSSFKGSGSGERAVSKGPVSSGDLPAVYVLKTILELKVIQAGWWHDVELVMDASQGAALEIRADPEKRERIIQWIKEIAANAPPDKDFAWMREVAVHMFDTVRPDLQALTWERDPQGTIQDIETIAPKFVQDVARVYF